MAEKHKTEEELKNDIFTIYTHCMNEISSDRRQTYFGQLCDKIFRLCRDCLFPKEAQNMGIEICQIVNRLIKSDNTKIKSDKNEFFMNLKTSLNNAKNEYYRKYESGGIIPKEKSSKFRAAEDSIRMKESNMGRKLTNDERYQCISKWFGIHEYTKIKELMNIGSLSFSGREEEKDALDTPAVSFFTGDIIDNPQDEYLSRINSEIICKAVKTVLESRQERARECIKALFTLFCVGNIKNIEGLYPVLDHEIIKSCRKDGTQPKQYEVYLKYHPEAKKDSANALASNLLKDFLSDLKSCLKKKNPEIFQ